MVDRLEDKQFSEAVSAELIRYGLRLRWLADGTDRLEWEDLWAIIKTTGSQHPIADALNPSMRGWDTNTTILADIADYTRISVWQRSGGQAEFPKLIPRPWDTESTDGPEAPAVDASGTYRGEAVSMEEIDEMLGR